ncbi:oxidoreductase [Rhizorhabdus dicambivorans]|uniref:Oxidoreductase n=1 Tax=Rhizorhabdus dicambivorans TaxID=1850238 RepID=A0A2A4FTY8_9SPHN|nr:oxidoreductase [Rhizorhabdus dicambivorans]ATE65751.1 oxidoreductase [Rhizorhabdus dicambivorans]PCE41166.1 oxidoreductase [Rhizorhabdus dicambivorans]
MNRHLKKTAIVTGASTGIGHATAEALASAGFTVFGTSRRPNGTAPDRVSMLPCDVTDEESVTSLVATVLGQVGRIDLLVNNAGLGLVGGAEESSIDQVMALFDVNLFGAMRVTNAVLPAMRRQADGRILNMSSVLGLIPGPYSAHYSATKHALEGYSESLDHEVRAFGIRVSLIEPAFTRGAFDQNGLKPDATLDEYDRARADAHALLADVMPKGDLPEGVADTVVQAATAASPRRRYTSGKLAWQISLLRRLAPAGIFDKSLRKQLRLPA